MSQLSHLIIKIISFQVYIKHHFLLSVASNNPDAFILQVYIYDYYPFPPFVVTTVFKYVNDHILITSILCDFEETLYHH